MAIIRINPDRSFERLNCGVRLRDLRQSLGSIHIEDAGNLIFNDADGDRRSFRVILDKDGRRKKLQHNELASLLMQDCQCSTRAIYGHALIVRTAYNTSTHSFLYAEIPEEQIGGLLDYLNELREELEQNGGDSE